MKLAMTGRIDDEFLSLARQLGATDIICAGSTNLPSERGYYEFQELLLLRKRIEDAGLRWAVLVAIPAHWDDKIKLGLPGRDEQIDNLCKTLKNMGAAGIPVCGYNFSLRGKDPGQGEQAGFAMEDRGLFRGVAALPGPAGGRIQISDRQMDARLLKQHGIQRPG